MLTVPQTAALLRTFDNILILTHVRPDGDTVGCAAALCAGLRSLGKAAFLLPNPELTDTTAPYSALTRRRKASHRTRWCPRTSPRWACSRRTPDHTRNGWIWPLATIPLLSPFGRENIVRPEAAACGELIYDILSDLGPITPEMALPLYVAVSTDTGCFAYANTTAQTPCGGGRAAADRHRLSDRQQGVLPHQEPQADAAGGRHPQRLYVLRPRPGGGAVRAPLPDGADRRLGNGCGGPLRSGSPD